MYDSRMLDLDGVWFPSQIIRTRTGQWTLTLLELSDLRWTWSCGWAYSTNLFFPLGCIHFLASWTFLHFSFPFVALANFHTNTQRQGGEKWRMYFRFFPLFPNKSTFVRLRRTRSESYTNTGLLPDFHRCEFMRESWRETYRIIPFRPRCCLLPAVWENMSAMGIFLEALLILDRTETNIKGRCCIPPSCTTLSLNIGLSILLEIQFCPWNVSIPQWK